MDKKYRILIVHNKYQINGGEDTVVENETALLREGGHEVIQYIRSNDEITKRSKLGKILIPFEAIYSFRTSREIKRIIKEQNIDLVHVHNTLMMVSPSVYYAALKCKVPVVQTLHNFRMVCPNALLYRDGHSCDECIKKGLRCAIKHNCYRNSKAQTIVNAGILFVHRMSGIYKKLNYICLTEFNKSKLLQAKNGKIMDASKMFIKPNYAEYSGEVLPRSARKQQFVYVGRPERIKGIFVLLDAWKTIENQELIICGASEELEQCKEYVEKNQIHNVVFKGKIDNQEVKKILSESIAMILPTQLFEGFPMTIVESMACGTPVIGSNIGNVDNLIKDGENGFRFQFDSSKDLAQKVKMITEAQSMVDKTRELFLQKYSREENYNILMDIYQKVLEN